MRARLTTNLFATGVAILGFAITTASAQTTFQATEDAYVNGSSPTAAVGAQLKVLVNNSPDRIGYSKFDVSSLTGQTVTSATLRIYPDFVNSPGPVQVQRVNRLAGDDNERV